MTFAVGDRVRVSFNLSGFFGQIGTIVAVDWKKTLPYQVDLQRRYSVFFDKDELELVKPETPEVGDMVRVSVEGTVERCEDRDGGVVMVGVSDGGAIWVKAKYAEVTSKAAKEPVVLRVGDLISSNDLKHLPVGSAFVRAQSGGIAYTVARKGSKTYGTSHAGIQYLMTFDDKKSYKIIYIANNTESVEVPNA